MEPIPNLHSVAVNRQRFAFHGVGDEEGNQLFRLLIGAVGVGASRYDYRQSVGAVVGAGQKLAAGFARGVGAVWRQGVRLLGEALVDVAVDLVGGNLNEPLDVVASGGLAEGENAHDVGVHGVLRVGDAAVHVAFRGEIDDYIAVFNRLFHVFRLADVALDEFEPRVVFHVLQVLKVSGVGEGVEYGDFVVVVFIQHIADEVAADKSGGARYE